MIVLGLEYQALIGLIEYKRFCLLRAIAIHSTLSRGADEGLFGLVMAVATTIGIGGGVCYKKDALNVKWKDFFYNRQGAAGICDGFNFDNFCHECL